MPYTIKQNDKSEFCVHKKGEDDKPTGKSLGCHKTKKEATDQIAAIESSENKKMTDSVNYIQVNDSTSFKDINWSENITFTTTGANWYRADDNGDLVHDSILTLVVNGVEITTKMQPLNDAMAFGAVAWELGPFNPGIVISDFVISAMGEGNLHVWLT